MSSNLGVKPWKIWRRFYQPGKDDKVRLALTLICANILLMAIPYAIVNRIANYLDISRFNPYNTIDELIPFSMWMIIPYLSLYLYYPAVAILGVKNEQVQRENLIFHQIMLYLTWFVLVIFLLIPVEVDLRHQIILDPDSAIAPLYELMHWIDHPWNSWPSLHVLQSLLIVLMIRRWYPSQNNKMRVLHLALVLAWLSLVLSTMMVKQHYAFDCITAITLAGLAWHFWIRPSLDRLASSEGIEAFNDALSASDLE